MLVALAPIATVALTITTASVTHVTRAAASVDKPAAAPTGIHKIKHIVIIMQENRSFDTYFGTYRGADGIPGVAGNPGKVPCVPDPAAHDCVKPYLNTNDINGGGPTCWSTRSPTWPVER